MGYNAIKPDAVTFHRGVISRQGGRVARAFTTVKQPAGTDDFINPFKLPETPDLPRVLRTVFVEGGTLGGAGVTYDAPTFTITVAPTLLEAGSTSNITVTPNWTRNDAGAPTAYSVSLLGQTTFNATNPVAHTFNNVQFTDVLQTINVALQYAAGDIKKDGDGNDVPGRVPAGTFNRSATFRGFRRAFWTSFSSQVSTPTDGNVIRGWTGGGAGEAQRNFVVPVAANMYDTIIALPAILGNNISAIINGFEQGSAFTRTTVSVPGANNTLPTNYNVWHLTSLIPMPAFNINVTIT